MVLLLLLLLLILLLLLLLLQLLQLLQLLLKRAGGSLRAAAGGNLAPDPRGAAD